MKLLLGLSLFLAAVTDIQTLVDEDFGNCLNFFYKNHVPTGFDGIALPDLFNRSNFPDGMDTNDLSSPAYICQTLDGTSIYATLYDRGRRMPLYSAYIMDIVDASGSENCSQPLNYKYEPQLVYQEVTGDMTRDAITVLENYNEEHKIDEEEEKNRPSYLLETSQTGDKDYPEGDYSKWKLSPCIHHSINQEKCNAAFTFTNVAPMIKALYKNVWSLYEAKMIHMSTQSYASFTSTNVVPKKEELQKSNRKNHEDKWNEQIPCEHLYLITGIVPGNVRVPGSRLISPAYAWNALCCVRKNGRLKFGAALLKNVEGNDIRIFRNVGEFQAKLKHLLGVSDDIVLFHNNCGRDADCTQDFNFADNNKNGYCTS